MDFKHNDLPVSFKHTPVIGMIFGLHIKPSQHWSRPGMHCSCSFLHSLTKIWKNLVQDMSIYWRLEANLFLAFRTFNKANIWISNYTIYLLFSYILLLLLHHRKSNHRNTDPDPECKIPLPSYKLWQKYAIILVRYMSIQ